MTHGSDRVSHLPHVFQGWERDGPMKHRDRHVSQLPILSSLESRFLCLSTSNIPFHPSSISSLHAHYFQACAHHLQAPAHQLNRDPSLCDATTFVQHHVIFPPIAITPGTSRNMTDAEIQKGDEGECP
jgi:hypothetical protein